MQERGLFMMSHFMLLQLLLYMDFGGNSAGDYSTEHCLAFEIGKSLAVVQSSLQSVIHNRC